jgi:hypothetical protein
MKVIKLCFLGIIYTIFFSACNSSEKTSSADGSEQRDSIAYTYQTITERAGDCGVKADSNCTAASFIYPQFNTENIRLEETIKEKLGVYFGTDTTAQTLEEQSKKFVSNYTEFKKEDGRTDMFWTLTAEARIIGQYAGLINVEFTGYSYAGGAHGSSGKYYLNWNTESNKEIILDDLFLKDYESQLEEFAEKIFRKNEQLTASESLAGAYFFENDQFSLNKNFLITPEGLKFTYNQYEIKPYVAGMTDLIIPYGEIKSLIKPNSILEQFIK